MLHKNPQGQPCALISNIQKYTIHDGPGIRTALFLPAAQCAACGAAIPRQLHTDHSLAFIPTNAFPWKSAISASGNARRARRVQSGLKMAL